ncbi:hypothetical protein BJX76DRAFT_356340 [Aspergillus varians]
MATDTNPATSASAAAGAADSLTLSAIAARGREIPDRDIFRKNSRRHGHPDVQSRGAHVGHARGQTQRVILMGHSSGAHVVTLLGTDIRYLERAGVSIETVRGVIALDGSNYNAPAEILDSPGSVAENMMYALGRDFKGLRAMSPTCNARAPNARAFLLLHTQRQGDIRQAVELVNTLTAAGSDAVMHVFEGHLQMLLRLGDPAYPATLVMEDWLKGNVPVA